MCCLLGVAVVAAEWVVTKLNLLAVASGARGCGSHVFISFKN